MTDTFLQANGLRLAYDEFGDPQNPALVLIMGLGTQMIGWTETFCQSLADTGLRVIRFDNRDIGLSDKMEGRVPSLPALFVRDRLKMQLRVPYYLEDMAKDTVGVLDALQIDAAHFVGASMGGMIAQLVAGLYPQRVLSLTSIMSSSGRRKLPPPQPHVRRHMLNRPKSGDERDLLMHAMQTWRLIGSPEYMATDEELRDKILSSFKRSYHPAGYARQMAAIVASGDRVSALRNITAPSLVIHGKADPLVPVQCGIDTAVHIRGAKLSLIDGMGHDLPPALYPQLVDLIAGHAHADAGDRR